MAVAQSHQAADPSTTWQMYRALVGVGILCGLLIVTVFVVTLPVIEHNQAEALERAVFRVLPGAASKQSFTLNDDGSFRPASKEDLPANTVHAGYDEAGALVGVAVQGEGMGYQDVIRVLYGYAPATQTIVGHQVLASKETPGLGDKIETDAVFLQNFVALDVRVAATGQALENPIELVKSGEKTEAWQIDSITGATISSRAIANTLRDSSQRWIPLIRGQLNLFEQPGASDDPS